MAPPAAASLLPDTPALADPASPTSASGSDTSVEEAESADAAARRVSNASSRLSRPQRPSLETRKSSGTIIVERDSPYVEIEEEDYDEGDARTMSPRRSSDEIERMGDDARQALEEQAQALQESLMEIVERVESVKSEHEKLEGGNKFLQSYIGELMQTSKITSAGAVNSVSAASKPTGVKGGYLGRSAK